MKIYGDNSEFRTHAQEGLFGNNDVLKGKKSTIRGFHSNLFGTSHFIKTLDPTLHLHIPKTTWSTFTGKLREYCLPWRWKTAYLDQEDGTPPRKILICTSVRDGNLSEKLKILLGKSLFVANLIKLGSYDEYWGDEYLALKGQNDKGSTLIIHPLGEMVGRAAVCGNVLFCHIYRQRSLFSTFKYYLIKYLSTRWKEIALEAGQTSERVLIKKSDEEAILRSGLMQKNLTP